jgi:AGZA family xanthine/uracil permease-like MFS transporter
LDAVLAPIARYFKFADRKTSLVTETRAGLTTFMVMAYIIAVNPLILSVDTQGAGPGQVQTIIMTCIVAGLLTLAMGLVTNYPFAMAAGMGLNAVVAFDLILGRGMKWEEAMAVIAWEGLIITILVLTGLREAIMRAIPMSLKRSIGVGIGLFILFIGLQEGGFVIKGDPLVTKGAIVNAPTLVFVCGLALTLLLMARKIKGALLISIVASTILAIILNQIVGVEKSGFLPGTAQVPDTWVTDFGSSPFSTVGAPLGYMLSIWTDPALPLITLALVVFTLMLSDFFDTMGTVIGVGEEAGLLDGKGNLPRLNRVLVVDSLGALFGGLGSTSSNTTYIESAAGVSEGGRTGFTSVVVGVLFLIFVIFAPVVTVVPQAATAPALVVVGYLMFTIAKDIEWGEIDDLFPAMLVMIVMPLTYSITNGIAAGFVAFVFLKLVKGKLGEVHPLMWLTAVAFVLYFASDYIQILVG